MIRGSLSEKTKERDRKIYDYLRREVQSFGEFPTIRRIASELRLSSLSMVEASLSRLEQAGLIEKEGRKRTLAGLEKGTAIPVLGTIAAGTPLLAVEQIEGYVHLSEGAARGRELFGLTVRGESMIEAGILPGDIVIFEQTSVLEDGEIGAVLLGEEATVKRFFREAGGFRLQPENRTMEPIFCKECEVLGRLCALIRNYE